MKGLSKAVAAFSSLGLDRPYLSQHPQPDYKWLSSFPLDKQRTFLTLLFYHRILSIQASATSNGQPSSGLSGRSADRW